MFGLPTSWAVGAVAAAALVAALGVQTGRLGRAESALATEKAAHQADLYAAEQAASAASTRYRAEESRRTAAQQEAVDAARKQTDLAQAAATAAAATGGRLRSAAAAAAARCGAAARDPAAASGSAPATDAGVVLADVLGRMEARGRELAAAADAARVAGDACVGAYQALTPASSAAP